MEYMLLKGSDINQHITIQETPFFEPATSVLFGFTKDDIDYRKPYYLKEEIFRKCFNTIAVFNYVIKIINMNSWEFLKKPKENSEINYESIFDCMVYHHSQDGKKVWVDYKNPPNSKNNSNVNIQNNNPKPNSKDSFNSALDKLKEKGEFDLLYVFLELK
jgi:hypothetical protein